VITVLMLSATVFCCAQVRFVPIVVGKKTLEPSMETTTNPCDAQWPWMVG